MNRGFAFVVMFITLSWLFQASATTLTKTALFPHSLGSSDFFVMQSHSSQRKLRINSSLRTEQSCRDNIKKVVCLVEPVENAEVANRECLAGSEDYAIYFERMYDKSPPVLQKMYCSLNHLYIEKDFLGTAYAGAVRDENGNLAGAIMGIRQSVLDEDLSLTTWASWKEQLSFGGNSDSYTITPDLPQIETGSQGEASDFLYFVVAHEFGHIFDFANELNKTVCEGDDCAFAEGTWGSIGWQNFVTPLPANEFSLRDRLCFYWCDGNPMNKDQVTELYAGLAATDFISIYATTNPMDDFADSLAYFLMERNLNTSYRIDTKQNTVYDIMTKLKSPLFASKHTYLENFLNRTDIVYP